MWATDRWMVGPRVKTYLRFIGANVYRWRFDTIVRLADALGIEPGVLLRRVKLVEPKSGRPRKRRAR